MKKAWLKVVLTGVLAFSGGYLSPEAAGAVAPGTTQVPEPVRYGAGGAAAALAIAALFVRRPQDDATTPAAAVEPEAK